MRKMVLQDYYFARKNLAYFPQLRGMSNCPKRVCLLLVLWQGGVWPKLMLTDISTAQAW